MPTSGVDGEDPHEVPSDTRGVFRRLWDMLPQGGSLPADSWQARHKVILVLLWLHIPLLVAFGLHGGFDSIISNAYYESVGPGLALLEGGVIALFALMASWPRLSRRVRSVAASVGLVTCSAVLTQFSGGFIEAHFHFFVMLGVIAMYLDWIPFLLAVGYVAVHHGTVGTYAPESVYNHPAAIAAPWRWAFIHAFFVLGLSVAQISHWRMTENARARTESVLASTADGILGIGAKGKIIFSNAAAGALLDRRPEDLAGQDFHTAVDFQESLGDDPVEAIRDGRPRHGSATLQRGDVPIEWSSNPVRHAEMPIGAVVTLRDVTEQRRAEADRAYLASIVQASRDAIIGLDLDGTIVSWNEGAEAVYGYSASEAIGKNISIVALDGKEDEVHQVMGRLKHGETVAGHEAKRRRRDGTVIDVSISASPLRDGSGEPTGISSIVRDITSQRLAEAEREQQRETERRLRQLQEQDAFKSRFINAAAHELNTPLTPINIYLRLLQKADLSGLGEKQQEAIKVVDRNFKRFSRLVGDLLDSARIQGGRLSMDMREMDVGETVVREAVSSFQAAAQAAGIELTGEAEEGLTIQADAERLTQVVYNLLNNALKFTPKGGHVQVRAYREDGHAVVAVVDDGPGLSKEQISQLFQPFSQVHEHQATMERGTGLGLYLSRAIVGLHKGDIWCESEGPGKGSRFIFRLPLAKHASAAAPQAA